MYVYQWPVILFNLNLHHFFYVKIKYINPNFCSKNNKNNNIGFRDLKKEIIENSHYHIKYL